MKPTAVTRHKRTYGKDRAVYFVEYEHLKYPQTRFITGTVIRGTDKSLEWYFGTGQEGLKEANRIALLSDKEFSQAEDLPQYSWKKIKKALTKENPHFKIGLPSLFLH